MESTGIGKTFKTLLGSYLTSDELLKLKPGKDDQLIEHLDCIIQFLYPQTISTITPTSDQLRYNAYYRMFGYKIEGENAFPLSKNTNSEYEKIFEELIQESMSFILDEGITTEKLGDPAKLAVLFNQMRSLLTNRSFNTIPKIAISSKERFEALEGLLHNDSLMVEQLSIKAIEPYNRLLELGEKLSIPIPQTTQYYMDLARRMDYIVEQILNQEWLPEDSENFVVAHKEVFKSINTDWYQITKKNLQKIALVTRKR